MIEDNNLEVLHLCSLLNKIKIAEMKALRAQYRVSYYRKIKTAILAKEPKVFLSRRNLKWKNNLGELNKKIEQSRIAKLKTQKTLLDLKNKLRKPIEKLLFNLNAYLVHENGRIIEFFLSGNTKLIRESEFAERAEQYEATLALSKILSRRDQ